MKLTGRRAFIRNTAGAALAFASVQNLFGKDSTSPYVNNMGVQLHTLRNPIAKDLEGTIKALVAAGYGQAEAYSFSKADAMIKAARDQGLQVNSCHFSYGEMIAGNPKTMPKFAKLVEKAHKQKITHLVIPSLPPKLRTSVDDYKRLAAQFNQAAVIAKEAGIYLTYHNHSFEFEPLNGDKSGYDVFIEEFSEDVKFEIDVFWAKFADIDPVGLIEKLKGRVTQLHLKDLAAGQKIPSYGRVPKSAFTEIGKGIINMEAVMIAALAAGVEHCHVEQDESPHPVKSVEMSMSSLQG